MQLGSMPHWLVWSYAGVVGAALGSFLNVCVHRWPLGQSVVRPRSRCPGCGREIAWHDNVPVLGWLLLRGRCRGCGSRISAQYPLIELLVGLIWAGAVALLGPSVEALRMAAFLTILLGIALTDARHMLIPDQFSLGGAALGLALAAVPGGFPFTRALTGALAGYVFLWIVKLAAEKAFRKPALGVGDIHMMALVGAFVGISGVLLTLLLGSVLGLLIGVPLTWWRGRLKVMGTYLPLGVFLAMGAAVAFVWGEAIVAWYLAAVLGTA
jgi:leader peptidase (prepilin peptidase)/N-methyltransferase